MAQEYKQFYRRHLPHIHSPGSTLFVTFRLHGSIPQNVLKHWKAEREHFENLLRSEAKSGESSNSLRSFQERLEFNRLRFAQFEEILHKTQTGPTWLKDPKIAKIVAVALHHHDQKSYVLDAFCIMSNHVHVVFTPHLNERSLTEIPGSNPLKFETDGQTVPKILQSIKGYSGYESNKLLKRKGKFRQDESYDHEVRDNEEYSRIVAYVLSNPVKAGLVKYWQDWPWNYTR